MAAVAVADDRPRALLADISEVRRRIIGVLYVLGLGTGAGFLLAAPLLQAITRPAGELIYLAPAEALMTHLRLAFSTGLAASLPVALVNVGIFAGRRLPRRTRRRLWSILLLSLVLFLAGAAFAFFLVLPTVLRFFLSFATPKIRPLFALSRYISFVYGLVVPFGLVFQLPLMIAALAGIGILSPAALARSRRVSIVLVFVVSALLTPPDVVSQMMMAVPMLLLFELGVVLARIAWRRPASP